VGGWVRRTAGAAEKPTYVTSSAWQQGNERNRAAADREALACICSQACRCNKRPASGGGVTCCYTIGGRASQAGLGKWAAHSPMTKWTGPPAAPSAPASWQRPRKTGQVRW
jgi:hypothetical protein